MWLSRVLRRIQGHPGPILIEGGETYGAPFLIEELSRSQRVAWLMIQPSEAGDLVAIGNALAEAVNRALEANFLLYAFPFTYQVDILKKHLPKIDSLTVVCSNADYNPLLRDSLLSLNAAGAKVIFIVDKAALTLPAGLRLRREELELTPEEAEMLAQPHLEKNEAYLLWRSSGGAYLTFMSSVCRLINVPLPQVPSPKGGLVDVSSEELVAPPELIDLLCKLGRYVEALELAVATAPERVVEFIDAAGQNFVDQGLQKRLHLLLENLDEKYLKGDKMLEWRLQTAFGSGEHYWLMPEIEAHLKIHEAPELRARYAGLTKDLNQSFAHAQRAVAARKTPLTLAIFGHVHHDPEIGSKVLRESLKLAEASGRPYDITRSALFLTESLIFQGRFSEAESWGKWALQVFDSSGLKDGLRRLQIIKNYADAQIMMGHTEGWLPILKEAKKAARSLRNDNNVSFLTTLINLEVVLGHFEEAERLAEENITLADRYWVSDTTVQLVRILLEQGRTDEALSRGKDAFSLTSEEDPFFHLPACLALGMTYTFTEPELAAYYLKKVFETLDIEAAYRITAALHLLKIDALKFEDLGSEMQEMLKALTPSAFRLSCGPEAAFAEVKKHLYSENDIPLQIKVLGQKEVTLNNQTLSLTDRALEVLVLLALHPEGLPADALHEKLYEKGDKRMALRAAVSRLRNVVPISGHPEPYRITIPFEFDADKCEKAIASSDVETAIELYQGGLLERSQAPGIVEARSWLEERLRQSVLHTGTAEVLMPLAEKLRDDLEVWKALHASLPTNDARLPFVRTHLQRVQQEFNPALN